MLDETAWYLPGTTIDDFERQFAEQFSGMASAIWLRRPGADAVIKAMRVQANEFDSDTTGRGDSFRKAHERSSVKATGMSQLLELATGVPEVTRLPEGFLLMDVLGGDGTLVRVTRELPQWHTSRDWILTGDVSSGMVRQALGYGLPAVRQPAQFLLCHEASFDAVLVAYGAHHIPVAERRVCYEEALRALKPGGRLVVHDFEVGTPMARWFEEIVDGYSPTGHKYTHFAREEFVDELRSVGFGDVELKIVYDPITVRADTPEQALEGMLQYVLNAYRLTMPGDETVPRERILSWVHELVTDCLRYETAELAALGIVPLPVQQTGTLTVHEAPGTCVAELPRLALVALANKP